MFILPILVFWCYLAVLHMMVCSLIINFLRMHHISMLLPKSQNIASGVLFWIHGSFIFLTVLLMYNGLKVYNLISFDICLHPWNSITVTIMKIFIIPESWLLILCNLSFPPLPIFFPISRELLISVYCIVRTPDIEFKAHQHNSAWWTHLRIYLLHLQRPFI